MQPHNINVAASINTHDVRTSFVILTIFATVAMVAVPAATLPMTIFTFVSAVVAFAVAVLLINIFVVVAVVVAAHGRRPLSR